MITTDLKAGAILRCIDPSGSRLVYGKAGAILRCIDPSGSRLVYGQEYILTSYNGLGGARPRARVQSPDGPPAIGNGWYLHRFELVRDGDGYEYQPPDDIDLQVDAKVSASQRMQAEYLRASYGDCAQQQEE